MRDYVMILDCTAPVEEDCAMVGTKGYREKAQEEGRRTIELIKKKLGEPVGSARLLIKANPHDFGSYYTIECSYQEGDLEAAEYAYACEAHCPVTWYDDEKVDWRNIKICCWCNEQATQDIGGPEFPEPACDKHAEIHGGKRPMGSR